MKHSIKLGMLVAAVSTLSVTGFAAIDSGLKPGAFVEPFQVVDVTGPNKGKELCYRCQYGEVGAKLRRANCTGLR